MAACIGGGVDVVQLRDPSLDDRTVIRRAEAAAGVCRRLGVPLILNDRPDLALAAGADGVHVGQDDCPPVVARRILGPEAIVGLSTHAPAELDASAAEPVDYISVGPVEPTPTKPGRPGTGAGYVSYAAGAGTRPFYITGGVSPATVAGLVDAGARRFVVVRWLVGASDPELAARELTAAIDDALARTAAPAPGTPSAPAGPAGPAQTP